MYDILVNIWGRVTTFKLRFWMTFVGHFREWVKRTNLFYEMHQFLASLHLGKIMSFFFIAQTSEFALFFAIVNLLSRIVCQYPYLRLEPAFYTWYCTKIVKFSLISLCFCQQTLRECEFPEVYDYQDSSNNNKWVFN